MDRASQKDLVARFAAVRVLCVGDVMLDEFVAGDVKRISPESPVAVFSKGDSEFFAGGAANVARNIAALGGRCTVLGAIGDDAPGRRLLDALHSAPRVSPRFVVCKDRPTTEKTRFVAKGQHVLRVDRELSRPMPAAAEQALLDIFADEIDAHGVVVLSDYAKGTLTDFVLREAIARAKARNIPVLVDPKSRDLARYAGASVITPNAGEIEAATGIAAPDDAQAAVAAERGIELADADAVLVTRAEKGMTLVARGHGAVHIASRVREVSDVVGAGDTTIATLALVLGAGGDLEMAARIANLAAGISVTRHGTSTVSPDELANEIADGHAKIVAQAQIRKLAEAWRGRRVAFTNGCFDILHVGHIRLLEFARGCADRLIVGVNTDASVRRLKGPDRPLNNENDRAEMLAALSAVDAVVLFDEDTPLSLIETIAPDVLVKGADYALEDIVGADFVLARGGEVRRFELVPDRSTTRIAEAARAAEL